MFPSAYILARTSPKINYKTVTIRLQFGNKFLQKVTIIPQFIYAYFTSDLSGQMRNFVL